MKNLWYWLFTGIFFVFILFTRGLFTSYQREGENPGSLNEFLLSLWWGCIAVLLLLLIVKWISEKGK